MLATAFVSPTRCPTTLVLATCAHHRRTSAAEKECQPGSALKTLCSLPAHRHRQWLQIASSLAPALRPTGQAQVSTLKVCIAPLQKDGHLDMMPLPANIASQPLACRAAGKWQRTQVAVHMRAGTCNVRGGTHRLIGTVRHRVVIRKEVERRLLRT